jgi:integrase
VVLHIAFLCGLRLGEILGLEWRDIDFRKRTLSVCRASQYVTGTGIITKRPKTEGSTRTIAIPKTLVELLEKYKLERNEEVEKLGSLWNGTARLFTQWDGKPMHPSAITHWFQRFLKRTGVPVLNFHTLRHSSATMMIVQGIHPKTISNRLGHANISTTMDIYGHALESPDREAADKLADILTKKKL